MEEVKALIRNFGAYTGSPRADRFLEHWEDVRRKFVKVYPNDYRRVIETQKQFKAQGLSDEEAIMAAFEGNAQDLMRVGGK
jgi:glutamate synthase (ferredoxin)